MMCEFVRCRMRRLGNAVEAQEISKLARKNVHNLKPLVTVYSSSGKTVLQCHSMAGATHILGFIANFKIGLAIVLGVLLDPKLNQTCYDDLTTDHIYVLRVGWNHFYEKRNLESKSHFKEQSKSTAISYRNYRFLTILISGAATSKSSLL